MATPNKTYRKLLSERLFLKVARRARAVTGIQIVDIKFDGDTVIIKCNSATTKGVQWTQRIQIINLVEHKKFEKVKKGVEEGKRDFASHARKVMIQNYKDPLLGRTLEKSIMESPIRVYCNCLAEGTRILTSEGYKEIQDVRGGDLVIGSDSRWHEVCGVLKSPLKKNWAKINIR